MKNWLSSKTIWVNLGVTLLGGIVTLLQTAPLDPQTIGIAVSVLGAINVYLRSITTQPIGRG